MARLLLALIFTSALLAPPPAGANTRTVHRRGTMTRLTRGLHSDALSADRRSREQPTTDPVALSLKLAEQFWHGAPACGTPTIQVSSQQLPNSDYERVTSPEPKNTIVEMWTYVPTCTIVINASAWSSWREDDESFQWFCDAMTHEVGHLFGHPDSGQTDASSITYPFLAATTPNFNSVPECANVSLTYGSETIRNEQVSHQ